MDQAPIEPIEFLKEEVKKLQEMMVENNTLLRGIQRRGRLVMLGSSLKWLIIIGISLGSFYFLKPLFDTYKSLGLGENFQNLIK